MYPSQKLIILACVALSVNFTGYAQTFEELEATLKKHPSLEALDLQSSSMQDLSIAAMALPDPVVSIGINNFPVFDPSFTTYLPTHKSLSVQQKFTPHTGRQARAKAASIQSIQLNAIRDQRLAALTAQLQISLIEKKRIQIQAAFANERDSKYTELVDVVETEIDAGRPALFRLAEIEAERADVARELVELQNQTDGINASLIELIGFIPDTPPPPQLHSEWNGDIAQFHAVRVQQTEISLKDAGIEEAKSEWKPEWGAQLTYQQRESGANFNGDDWVSGVVTFSVPIWAHKKQEPKLRAASAAHDAAQLNYRNAARVSSAQYSTLSANKRAAQKHIDILQQKSQAIQNKIEAQMTIYESGTGDYAPIIDGEIAILKLRSEIAAQSARIDISTAQLNALTVQS